MKSYQKNYHIASKSVYYKIDVNVKMKIYKNNDKLRMNNQTHREFRERMQERENASQVCQGTLYAQRSD